MDKIRKQKLDYFLLDLDGKIKEIKYYLMLDKGAVLLDAIEKFEEENAEFLQYYSSGQDDLNKRKWIIQFILFPIISDDKVEELLQYHLLEALEAGLDLEELMKMRAITISELLWPKLSQQYLKALMQNTQLIGGDPLSVAGEKSSFLPYIKNWISIYNRRFGIEKHTGLEPHQFVLEDANTQRLSGSFKEKLLKMLNFYESIKVYSLSEIESDLRKMKMRFSTQQAAAYSLSKNRPSATKPKQVSAPPSKKGFDKEKLAPFPFKSSVKATEIPVDLLPDKRIRIVQTEYPGDKEEGKPKIAAVKSPISGIAVQKERSMTENHVLELLEKYPALREQKVTTNSISLPIAPFNLTPTLQNWIQHYFRECGRGKHSPQERESFIELLRKSQNLNTSDEHKLQKIFRSVDEKITLPFDKKNNLLLLDLVGVSNKLKIEKETEDASAKSKPVMRITASGIENANGAKKDRGYLDLELMPTEKNNETKN